jgi:hypothetical protein
MESCLVNCGKRCFSMGVYGDRLCGVVLENVASERVSRDTDDIENITPRERVVDSFDFDNREDGK